MVTGRLIVLRLFKILDTKCRYMCFEKMLNLYPINLGKIMLVTWVQWRQSDTVYSISDLCEISDKSKAWPQDFTHPRQRLPVIDWVEFTVRIIRYQLCEMPRL